MSGLSGSRTRWRVRPETHPDATHGWWGKDDSVIDIVARLTEVSEKGAPAHRESARLLIAALSEDATDVVSLRHAELLLDAYLHDPYLTRY